MPLPEPRFSRPADRIEHVGSAVTFALLICIWIAGYVALVPAEPVQHHVHIAKVRA